MPVTRGLQGAAQRVNFNEQLLTRLDHERSLPNRTSISAVRPRIISRPPTLPYELTSTRTLRSLSADPAHSRNCTTTWWNKGISLFLSLAATERTARNWPRDIYYATVQKSPREYNGTVDAATRGEYRRAAYRGGSRAKFLR